MESPRLNNLIDPKKENFVCEEILNETLSSFNLATSKKKKVFIDGTPLPSNLTNKTKINKFSGY